MLNATACDAMPHRGITLVSTRNTFMCVDILVSAEYGAAKIGAQSGWDATIVRAAAVGLFLELAMLPALPERAISSLVALLCTFPCCYPLGSRFCDFLCVLRTVPAENRTELRCSRLQALPVCQL
jgi:hypothetical protein